MLSSLSRVFALLSVTALQAAEPPNILFIYTDDHTHRGVSCYPEAHDFVDTPNIDQLAEKGVRFHHATIGTWCMPSRATMLTGHLQHGIESMRMEGEYPASQYDPEKCPFWPSVFRKNGYQTAQIGKWHTGVDSGFGRDWDYQVVWNRPRFPKNAGAYFYDQILVTNGGEPTLTEGYSTDNYTNLAVDFIGGKNRKEGAPWYLWVCYGAVHGPFTPADRHLEEYPDIEFEIPTDLYPPREGKPTYSRDWGEWVPGEDGQPILKSGVKQRTVDTSKEHGKTLQYMIRQYHQGVLAIDEGVGRMMTKLKETGQLENTLVVFTADQGYGWGQKGFRRKLAPYDGTIRSPLIFSFPGKIAEGKVCTTPVGGPDLPATFFRFAGLDLPWEMHGKDLTPLLEKPETVWDRPVLMSYTAQQYGSNANEIPAGGEKLAPAGVPWWISVVDGDYKYIRTLVVNEPEEIYHLGKDPEELVNLAHDPEHAELLKKLRATAIAELKRTSAGFVDSMPATSTGG